MKEIYRNLIYLSIVSSIIIFFFLIFSFLVSRIILGDPVLAYLPSSYTPSQYEQVHHQLGLDLPLSSQFLLYFLKMFIGNWGLSNQISHGVSVVSLLIPRLYRSVEVISIPLIVSLVLGVFLGMRSMKAKSRTGKRLPQIISLIILAIPIVLLSMGLQYFLSYQLKQIGSPLYFPTQGFTNPISSTPPFVTGSRFFDSILSGRWDILLDYLYHLALPWIALTIILTPFMILLVRSYLLNKLDRPSSMKHESITLGLTSLGLGFGMVGTLVILVESVFNLDGMGQLLITAMQRRDYWVENGCFFLISLFFTIFMIVGGLIFFAYRAIRSERDIIKRYNQQKSDEKDHNEQMSSSSEFKPEKVSVSLKIKKELRKLKDYLLIKLKSPFTIIGLIILIFVITISIFPQILTPYSRHYLTTPNYGAWSPPSPEHPLGQGDMGFDVLGRIVYGTQLSLLFGLGAVGIGLLGGIILGIPLNLFKRRFKMSAEILLTPVYMYPMMISVLLGLLGLFFIGIPITEGIASLEMIFFFGILLIPLFTQIIVNTKLTLFNLSKKIIPYIPLLMGFIIIIYFFLGFLGFTSPVLISLGRDVAQSRIQYYTSPWAAIFPMLALSFLLMGLFLLYAGLQKSPKEIQELQGTVRT